MRVKVKVKTVYGPSHYKEPDISEYKNKEEAQTMIDATLKWGIGILSCEIVRVK